MFSKVFSVPAVPGQNQNGFHSDGFAKASTPVEEKEKEKTPTSDTEILQTEASKSGSSGEDETSGDSGYIPKTPSTAERRKVFETRSDSKENEPEESMDIIDQGGSFERSSLQRTSIAERRKIYENRSVSVQEGNTHVEKKEGSPVMLRRKDSFKNRRNAEDILREDNNRKSVPISKQQSLDPVSSRKSEVLTPTPKRTSTVFGMFLPNFLIVTQRIL